MKAPRRLLALALAFIVLAVLASVSLAVPGSLRASGGPLGDVIVSGETEDDPGCETDGIDGSEGTDRCDDDEEEGDQEGDSGGDSDDGGNEVDPEREAACREAAGIGSSEDGSERDAEETTAHGLDVAIEHVLANCVKNGQAPGLINALERLAANRERHEAHEAWKAERKSARADEKAERQAAKADKHAGTPGHGKGHSGDGGHGNPHGGGSGGSHGSGSGQGGNGSHGNGHH